MENFDQHKIGIADMEVEIEPVVDAFTFRNEVRSVFYDDLLPGLELRVSAFARVSIYRSTSERLSLDAWGLCAGGALLRAGLVAYPAI